MLATKISTIRFIQKGEQGKQGVMPYPCGKWEANDTYVRTDQSTPFVLYDTGKPDLDIHYVLNRLGECIGINPVTSVANNDGVWQKFDRINFLFAKFAMIDKALLAGAVCSNDKMFSQFGSINGVESEDYTHQDFNPYLSLNWRTGEMFARHGVYSGSMRTQFKHIEESDAIYDPDADWWIVNNDVNLITGKKPLETIVLNPEPKNDGMIITICNINHPPFNGASRRLRTEIYYPGGISGSEVRNPDTDQIPPSVYVLSSVKRFIGVLEDPNNMMLSWAVLTD